MKRWAAERGELSGALVAIHCGANVNFDRLRHIAERAELGEGREVLLAVTIPERAGSFRRFCEAIGPRSVTEFNYRYADPDEAVVFVGVQVREGEAEKLAIVAALEARGYGVVDMSENEMAKVHVRYMVGGRAPGLADERLVRFQFPERPGALLQFLEGLALGWNISLFHYRNHGADYGRVLCGIQVPEADRPRFGEFLRGLGYRWWDESDNPAYGLFLHRD
jgi:threonine dehydratase